MSTQNRDCTHMTNETKHPADGPEQEITSETRRDLPGSSWRSGQAGAGAPGSIGPGTDEFRRREFGAVEDAGEDDRGGAPRAESEVPARSSRTKKLERLQKILAQAGVASRRHAEELITEGRVQVNGQTVTVLGTKADPERDHIRVDGKLLRGAERLRYFVLNKPQAAM